MARPRTQVAIGLLIAAVVTPALVAGAPALAGWQSLLGGLADALPALLVMLLVTIAVHELGHLLVGRLVGFRLRMLQLGPLRLLAIPAGWRPGVVTERPFGVQVLMAPAGPAGLRRRHAAMIAGGPALHLLLVAPAAVLAARGLPGLWAGAALTGLTGLANLVPWTLSGGTWSDGRWLVAWLTSPARAAQRVAVAALQLAATDGVPPRRWDDRWVPLATAPASDPGDRVAIGGALLAYAWALDAGRTAEAAGFLERIGAGGPEAAPAPAQQLARLEMAFFRARFDRDVAGAEALLTPLLDHLSPALAAERQRAAAAIHLAARRRQQALDACRAAQAGLAPGSRVPVALLELRRSQVADIRQEALRLQGGTPGAEETSGRSARAL